MRVTVEDGRNLAKSRVRKSRKRAIKEAQTRKRQAAQETAEAAHHRDAAEKVPLQFEKAAAAASSMKEGIEALKPTVQGYAQRAEKAAEEFCLKNEARKTEEENLAQNSREKKEVEQALKRPRVSDLLCNWGLVHAS